MSRRLVFFSEQRQISTFKGVLDEQTIFSYLGMKIYVYEWFCDRDSGLMLRSILTKFSSQVRLSTQTLNRLDQIALSIPKLLLGEGRYYSYRFFYNSNITLPLDCFYNTLKTKFLRIFTIILPRLGALVWQVQYLFMLQNFTPVFKSNQNVLAYWMNAESMLNSRKWVKGALVLGEVSMVVLVNFTTTVSRVRPCLSMYTIYRDWERIPASKLLVLKVVLCKETSALSLVHSVHIIS